MSFQPNGAIACYCVHMVLLAFAVERCEALWIMDVIQIDSCQFGSISIANGNGFDALSHIVTASKQHK